MTQLDLSQRPEWSFGKFVFVASLGLGYACALFALIYPLYMYLH